MAGLVDLRSVVTIHDHLPPPKAQATTIHLPPPPVAHSTPKAGRRGMTGGGGLVLAVGTGESLRSSLRSTLGLGRLSAAASSLSLASAATLNYDDLESHLLPPSQPSPQPFKSVVTLEDPVPSPSQPPPRAPATPPPQEEISAHPLRRPPLSDGSLRKPPRSRRSSGGDSSRRRPRLRPSRAAIFLPAHAWAPPPPPPPPPPQALVAAASPPVEMTGWRLNRQFDPASSADNRRLLPGRERRERREEAVLAPEDLPRLYPHAAHGLPHWTRTAVLDFDEEDTRKACLTQTTVIRVFIGTICTIGASCLVAGVVLGTLSGAGTTRLTLCGLMVGVGAVLVLVSGLAWRLTAFDPDHPARCCGLLRRHRSPVPRPNLPLFHQITGRHPYFNLTGRPHLPPPPPPTQLGPAFPFQPPPPSYQASLRDAQLLEMARPRPPLGSPPPTYRAHSRATTHPGILERPPSYRSDEDVPVVLVHQRPFSPSRDEGREGREAAGTSQVVVDDRTGLVGAAEAPAVSYRTSIAISDHDAVIDCSAATPRELRLPQDRGEIRRSLGPSAGRAAQRGLDDHSHLLHPPTTTV